LKPTTPKEVFAAKIQRLQLAWLEFPTNWESPEDTALLHRLCADDRMHEAWELLAQFDDDDFGPFIDLMLSLIEGVRSLPELRVSYREWRSEITEARIIMEVFVEMCETSSVFGSPPATIGKYFPDLLVQAKEAYLALAAEAANVRELEQDEVGDLSRKFGDGRAEMARDLIRMIKRLTGQPHYEAVAALLNTILDTGDDDEITADAVRKISTRAAQRDRTIRPPK
jgi:hypothetical protein